MSPGGAGGVLRSDNEEGVWYGTGHAVHRDTAFFHNLQQGGLGFRTGAVDFVRQDDLGHDGTFFIFHFTGFEIDEGKAGDVGGHQIGRKLDPSERTVEGPGEGAGQGRFTDAGDILNEDMAFAQEGDEGVFNGLLLTNDGFADILLQGKDHSAGIDHSASNA